MKKYIFLDRDGVINRDPKTASTYVTKWSEFHFLPRVKQAIRLLAKAEYSIFIISNQAGVSKGFYTKKELKKITDKMLKEIKRARGKIKKVLYCTHRTEDNCNCRKPKTGLFDKIPDKEKVRFSRCYFIGDSERDVITAKRAGLKSILVLSGKTDGKKLRGFTAKPDMVKKDLRDAAMWVIQKDKNKK